MHPVTFRRVVEAAFCIENEREISYRQLQDALSVSENRAKEILHELVRIGLISRDQQVFRETEATKRFIQAIKGDDWRTVHKILMDYSYYARFYTGIKNNGPIDLNNLPPLISDEEFIFNATALSVLSDWTLRIGTLQRNVFNSHYYDVDGTTQSFAQTLLGVYDDLNRSGIGNIKQRYVEIPKIREYVCEQLKISRKKFDTTFIDLYAKNIGGWELAGAPITTHAKQSSTKIKSLVFSQMLDRVSVELTSDRYLQGVEFGRKRYYYLAIHTRDVL
ncbi:hypothetical protein [Methanocalculus sp.]|uniref:hypothetical protein n=1 Tax=Methanocalculus sp. TaxID=2004547 RepID=UPI00263627B1|nr:hypothetical protein [Methanocalculus sp.]MDG6251757.1 hypothetical protein [Methanocalculus sp.]